MAGSLGHFGWGRLMDAEGERAGAGACSCGAGVTLSQADC